MASSGSATAKSLNKRVRTNSWQLQFQTLKTGDAKQSVFLPFRSGTAWLARSRSGDNLCLLWIPVWRTSLPGEHSGALLPPAGREWNDRRTDSRRVNSCSAFTCHCATCWMEPAYQWLQSSKSAPPEILLLNTPVHCHCNTDPALPTLVSLQQWYTVSLLSMHVFKVHVHILRGCCTWFYKTGHCSKFPLWSVKFPVPSSLNQNQIYWQVFSHTRDLSWFVGA